MESQKIDHKDEDDPRFQIWLILKGLMILDWYMINDHSNGNYSQGDDVRSVV